MIQLKKYLCIIVYTLVFSLFTMPFVVQASQLYTTGGIVENYTEVAMKHMDRLGIEDPEESFKNLLQFTQAVKMIESDGDGQAKNPESTAKGFFQFIDGSVGPAVKRASRSLGDVDWLKGIGDVRDLTEEQQATLFIADLFEKTAVVDEKKVKGLGDELMRGVLEGNPGKMMEAYYTLHHTKPDKQTKLRAAHEFMKIN